MKKPATFFLIVLLLIIAVACVENPTEIENVTAAESELYQLYLMKLEAKPLDLSFEEFKQHCLSKSSKVKKSGPASILNPDLDWESDYGENLDLPDDWYVNLSDPNDVQELLPADFSFRFFGVDYDSIFVHSNGFITFTEYRTFADITLPTQTELPIIAPLAADFDPGYDGMVAYKNMIGTAPNRIIVITWVDVPEFYGYDPNTFQLKLFEGSNKIQFGYNGLTVQGFDLGSDGLPDNDYPQEAGISSLEGQVYIAAAGDAIPGLDGTNICFTPTCADAEEYVVSYEACIEVDVPPPPCVDPTPGNAAEKIVAAKAVLEDLLEEDLIEKKLKKSAKKAVKEIDKSLDPRLWKPDFSEPDPKKGKKVFDHLKKAAKELKKFEKSKGASYDEKLAVEEVIITMVSVSRGFAETVLGRLDCSTGKCGKEREKALKQFNKAEEENAKRHWDHAIDKFKKAWQHAHKAIKHLK